MVVAGIGCIIHSRKTAQPLTMSSARNKQRATGSFGTLAYISQSPAWFESVCVCVWCVISALAVTMQCIYMPEHKTDDWCGHQTYQFRNWCRMLLDLWQWHAPTISLRWCCCCYCCCRVASDMFGAQCLLLLIAHKSPHFAQPNHNCMWLVCARAWIANSTQIGSVWKARAWKVHVEIERDR